MAMEMYTDLRMFDEAKALAETTVRSEVNDVTTTPSNREADVQEIIQRQAEWTEEAKDHETAADMYLVAGQPEKALALLVKHGPASKLIEVIDEESTVCLFIHCFVVETSERMCIIAWDHA